LIYSWKAYTTSFQESELPRHDECLRMQPPALEAHFANFWGTISIFTLSLALMLMGQSRPWSDRYLFSVFNNFQHPSVSFTTQHLIRSKRGLIADKGYFQEYFHTLLAQRLMESGYRLRRTDRGWHQWEMACITDREIELFSKRHELIDTLSEERGSTPEEERRLLIRSVIARQPNSYQAKRG
jgi:hypothetical protein